VAKSRLRAAFGFIDNNCLCYNDFMNLGWLKFLLGLWLIVSPFTLGYWHVTPALWNQVVTGAIIILLFLWETVGTESSNQNGEKR